MTTKQQEQVSNTINLLFEDSKFDYLKIMKGAAAGIVRPMRPSDFKDVYLSISKEQGKELKDLIVERGIKSIVEFGTSFGISTLYLAQGVLETGGFITTTELIESKASKARENFVHAGVGHLINVKVGDALDTLKDYPENIDLLLLDGWKNLYLPLFTILEPNFHKDTVVYVDNANMADTREFLKSISKSQRYNIEMKHQGKVALVTPTS